MSNEKHVKKFSWGLSWGRLCVHMYCTLTVPILYSLYSISDVSYISSWWVVLGGWVCKPILVIGLTKAEPQADQYPPTNFFDFLGTHRQCP